MKLMKTYTFLQGLILLLGLVQLSIGKKFNKKHQIRGSWNKDFGEAVLRELEDALGSGGGEHREQTEQKLHEFEAELQSTFKALPKNSRGALEGPYIRYALHRLFVQRYGWQVKGLEVKSGAWYEGAGASIMGDRVPPKMRDLFEKRLGNYGVVLHELAVLAATLDAMFLADVAERLRIVYAAYELGEKDILSLEQANSVSYAYISVLIVGHPVEQLDVEHVKPSLQALRKQERHQESVNLLRRTMPQVAGASPQSFDWQRMMSWLLAFGQQIGHLEDNECKRMKSDLIASEAHPGTGRVRMADFRQASVSFEESVSDLRSMEALDETVPLNPQVIIPNYLQGPTNCINPAGYYSICCLDECEELVDKIEAHFESPTASPSAISSFVSTLPSASQHDNRSLAPALLDFLEVLAKDQGGMVPLHSKGFAQWMHEAYPRECSHPKHADSDRFNESLRYTVDELQDTLPVSKPVPSLVDEPAQRNNGFVAYETIVTFLLGVVGMALAKYAKGFLRSWGKEVKCL